MIRNWLTNYAAKVGANTEMYMYSTNIKQPTKAGNRTT